LRFVLDVIRGIKERGAEPKLSFEEFALHVQTSTPDDDVDEIVERLLDYRAKRAAARGSVRAFDRAQYKAVAAEADREPGTLIDYADLTFRYLKATGLFHNVGRGIGLAPRKAQLAELIRQDRREFPDDKAYLQTLWLGAELPTDDAAKALAVLNDLATQLRARGVSVTLPPVGAALADIQILRYEVEQRLFRLDEEEYAAAQAGQVEEIAAWMEAIITGRALELPDGTSISVPRGEAPAYLEWVIWRAFLAINSLLKSSWEARNFEIDQDFLPVHCAPGGGPDMVFEFADYVAVLEGTLTSSSRQEAAEGEPVRRHVAQIAEHSAKRVYGLFIAPQIDSNTAHTFSSGAWYRPDDSKMALDIVPLTLADFRRFLLGGRVNLAEMPEKLRTLLIECRAVSNRDAPDWKRVISEIVKQMSS
jgi:hypothetical protein